MSAPLSPFARAKRPTKEQVLQHAGTFFLDKSYSHIVAGADYSFSSSTPAQFFLKKSIQYIVMDADYL